jgi:protein SCO1
MLQFFSKYKFFLIVLFVLSALIITIIYSILKPKEILPVFQPAEVNAELVDSTLHYKKKYHTIGNFSLKNQNGETITEANYENKIYVADFFFTTCQTICPIMTDHMVQIQQELRDEADVLLLSHTVQPEVDTIAQLKKYALDKGVDSNKWNLVTGEKEQIYNLARKSYLAAKDAPYSPYELIHTENFVLIDKKKRIRGFYDGTKQEAVKQLIEDIKILKAEDEPTFWENFF